MQTSLDITVVDTTKLGQLMDATSTAGFEQGGNPEWGDLMNVYYTLSDSDKIRDTMLADAILNARAKAENMAKAAGAILGAVQQIQEGNSPNFNYPRPVPMMAMTKAELTSSAPIAPPAGEQQMQASVTVTFELNRPPLSSFMK